MRSIAGCSIFLIIIMTSQIFAGNVYYIDATYGDDGNPGTKSQPWRTVQKAAITMVAGDTVVVKAGTYNERVWVSKSGNQNSLINYTAEGTVNIKGFSISGSYIKVKGFSCTSTGLQYDPNASGIYVSGDYCVIEDNFLFQTAYYGIFLSTSSDNCTIKNNHCNQTAFVGIVVQGNNSLIEHNEIEDTRCSMGGNNYNDADGIRIFNSGHTLRENYIHDISLEINQGCAPHIDGIQSWKGSEFQVATNCTIEKNYIDLPIATEITHASGIMMEDNPSNITIKNNIIIAGRGIHSDTGSNIKAINNTIIGDLNFPTGHVPVGIMFTNTSNSTIKNNIICEQPWGATYTWGSSGLDNDYNCTYNSDGSAPKGTIQAHDLWGIDPKFISLSEGNYHLRLDSPCIDAGTTLSEVIDDFDGTVRPFGAWYDIGAFEYVGENPPLDVNISASPTSGEIPLTVSFQASATGGKSPYSYNWDFGDGTSSSQQNPAHTYSQAGDYTVALIVNDSQNSQVSDFLTINTYPPPLVTSFTATPTSGDIPLIVYFTGNATGGTPPYSYNWNFGDGTSSTEQNPTCAYSQAGDYTVTLTVIDSKNNQDSDSVIITATSIPSLAASCSASPLSGEVPLTINFTGNATGGVLPYSFSWDFGDSTSSSEQNPSHTYSQAGDYTVTLTVTDSKSNHDSDSLTINAKAPATLAYLSSSPSSLYFSASTSGNETKEQHLRIINAGGGKLTWNIENNANWLSCSPISGMDRGDITIKVNASGLPIGLHTATIVVHSAEAHNSPQFISANLRVYEPAGKGSPYGRNDSSNRSDNIPVIPRKSDGKEITRVKPSNSSESSSEIIGPDRKVFTKSTIFSDETKQDQVDTPNIQNRNFELNKKSREDSTGRLKIGVKEVKREDKLGVDNKSEISLKDIIKIYTEKNESEKKQIFIARPENNITRDIPIIQTEEMEPIRIIFEGSPGTDITFIGWGEKEREALPIGSSLDSDKGEFIWMPTSGSAGRYILHFAVTDGSYMSQPIQILINVIPKRDRNKENL